MEGEIIAMARILAIGRRRKTSRVARPRSAIAKVDGSGIPIIIPPKVNFRFTGRVGTPPAYGSPVPVVKIADSPNQQVPSA
jgi:hypothetical protein